MIIRLSNESYLKYEIFIKRIPSLKLQDRNKINFLSLDVIELIKRTNNVWEGEGYQFKQNTPADYLNY